MHKSCIFSKIILETIAVDRIKPSVYSTLIICGLWHQRHASLVEIRNCNPNNTVGCNYLSLPEIPISDTLYGRIHFTVLGKSFSQCIFNNVILELKSENAGDTSRMRGEDRWSTKAIIYPPPPPPDKRATILADDIFKCIFVNGNDRIPIEISLKFVPRSPIDNKPALV